MKKINKQNLILRNQIQQAFVERDILLLTILQLYRLPPLLFLQSVTLLSSSLEASPGMPAVVLYCKIKSVVFFCVCF